MNANAIYSKSGKGVQEASGKTSHLSRPDRAVLSAIDGRATLADVAQKVGKTFDPAFVKLIESLDKGGFIREVSAGSAAPASGKPGAAKPAARPAGTGPMDAASDLDFTSFSTPSTKAPPPPQAPPRATPPPSKQSATIPPPPPPPSAAEKAKAEQLAKQQQDAMARAREEAEKKAQADRDRVKAEAEAKMRAEAEAKARAEAKEAADRKFAAELEAKHKAEAEAKIKAAQAAAVKAAAEAKAKADAEAKKAREEAERAKREAEEKAERARKEAEEKARREQEELRKKLEEERKAREEAERKAREEAKRLEEERRKLEEERKAREEERRREEEERAERRRREEEEEKERKRKKREAEEEEERREAEEKEARRRAKKQQEEEEEARERAEKEARRKAKEEEKAAAAAAELPQIELPAAKPAEKAPEPAPARAAGGGSFSDNLLADLESFSTNDERDQKEREEKERKDKEAAAQRAREAEERRQKEEAERAEREEKERRKREAAEQKEREEAELREREEREKQRLKDEEEKRKKEAEEREKKAKQEESLAAKATRQAAFDAEQRAKRERELMARPVRGAARRSERKGGFGKTLGIGLFLLILIGVGVAHVIPLDVGPYQTAASEALRRPVKIGSANLSLFTGLQLKFSDVSVGDTRIGQVRAHPSIGAITGPKKDFSLVEIDGLKIDQQGVGEALFTKMKGDNFSVARIVARKLELTGPLTLPKDLEGDLSFDAEGSLRQGFVRGPETLLAKFTPKGQSVEFDMSAQSFSVPFAPEITFGQFSMKGTATPQGLSIAEWDGQILNGKLSGTANVRWNDGWVVDGVMTARGINAAVFAPALLSDGRAEGSGKFAMRGQDPAKLADTSRIDGSFTVNRGVLGSIDLSRAIQTQGRFGTGRTQFNEMNGQAVYDRGAVSLRNVTISAGQLNAGASAEIAQNGALTGRIVAEVKIAQQHLRATLNLGGTVKDPQVKN